MPKWTEYTSKDTLADNDEVMLYDATGKANKRGLMSKFWDYVVDKMATAVISKLETDNKTIIGAINALNGKTLLNEYKGNIDELNGKYLVVANTYATGTFPSEFNGNRRIIIGDTSIKSSGNIQYGVQVAVSFGSNKIAIRNCPYTADATAKYSEWRYI